MTNGQAPQGGEPTNTAQTPVTSGEATAAASTEQTAAAPAKPVTVAQQFHPSLDPGKYDFSVENGRVRVFPKTAESAVTQADQSSETEPTDPVQLQNGQPLAQPVQTNQGQPADNPASQAEQIQNMVRSELWRLMNQQEPAQPVQPAEPDYSDVDMYDPKSAASFVQNIVRESVGQAIKEALSPHLPALSETRQIHEFRSLQNQHGNDPAFKQKAAVAMRLYDQGREGGGESISLPQAYGLVEFVMRTFNSAQPAATPSQPAAKQATRTITADQAQQKREQAQRLPASNSGVRGAGAEQPGLMPGATIANFGEQLLYNLMNGSQSH